MEIETVDEFIRAIVNDRLIFHYFDGGELFNKEEMEQLKEELKKEQQQKFIEFIKSKIDKIKEEINELEKQRNRNQERFIKNQKDCLMLANGILRSIKTMPNTVKEIFEILNDLGLLRCNLSNSFLEDISTLIRTTEQRTVEGFLLDKIGKARGREKEAEKRFMEYLKIMYALEGPSLIEKAFVIEKLHALENLKEVLSNE